MVDPETGGQTPVVSIILDLFLITIFLSLNGHLIAIDFLFKSFEIYNLNRVTSSISCWVRYRGCWCHVLHWRINNATCCWIIIIS